MDNTRLYILSKVRRIKICWKDELRSPRDYGGCGCFVTVGGCATSPHHEISPLFTFSLQQTANFHGHKKFVFRQNPSPMPQLLQAKVKSGIPLPLVITALLNWTVLSGDTIVLIGKPRPDGKPPSERILGLAYVSAPRMRREGDEVNTRLGVVFWQ